MLKRKIFWAALGLILALILILIFWGGVFLVREDPLRPVEFGVILIGHFPARILHGVDIYKQGMVEKLLMVSPSRGQGHEFLLEKGIYTPDEADLSREVAIRLGVNPADIVIVLGGADSTRQEALLIAGHLEGWEEAEEIILITSPSHSRRAAFIFARALGRNIISSPTSYEDFSGHRWWERRDWARQVVLEYQKFLHFLLWERFGL